MRVAALLLRLLAEVRLQTRKSLKLEPGSDGLVLERGEKLQPDLSVDGGGDFL